MDQFLITGGASLQGELPVNGAKNHALKLIPAAFLASGETEITNLPQVEDVHRLLEIVEKIGGRVNRSGDRTVTITPPAEFSGDLPLDLVPKLRASIVLLGPLLARYGRVALPHPGGCNLGQRPIDLFLSGFRQLGATVTEGEETHLFTAPHGLQGAQIIFPVISVTATETVMLAATLAKGTTVLKNAACEPEIVALAEYLNQQGAKITGAGTSTITIEGGALVNSGTVAVIPDRIEAGSFMILAAATNSPLTVTQCDPTHLEIPIALLREIGVPVSSTASTITVGKREEPLQPATMVTHEYPGFPTDLQAPMTVLLTQANGQSLVRETIYDGRLFYTDSLNTMGANISLLDPYRAQVNGPTPLTGKTVASPDIRAGIAMVIAGLIAEGQTTIQNIYQVDRGYERIEERLSAVGAQISRQ